MGKKDFWISIFGVPVFIGFVLYSCLSGANSCDNIQEIEKVREQSFHFKIEEKYLESSRFYTLIGKNRKGHIEKFHNMGYKDLYDAAFSGDTLTKIKGELQFKILKSDTTIVFDYVCDGKFFK